MNDNLIQNLNKALLKNTSQKANLQLFDDLMSAIVDVTQCTLCTLWSVNNNSTFGKNIFKSISIIIRKFKTGLTLNYPDGFVLKLDGTFIEKTINNTGCFFRGNRDDHKDKACLEEYDLYHFIGIPIYDFENSTQPTAVLKLSFTDEPPMQEMELFAQVVSAYISSSLYRHMLYKKQELIDKLVDNYNGKGRKNLENIFYPIIHKIFKGLCFDYEGASVFIWDSYDNRFNLLTTTGIKNNPLNKDVFYYPKEGLTGKVVDREAKIYDDLITLKQQKFHIYKYECDTKHEGETMLVVPILRPSNPNNVIGILRFINKINEQSKTTKEYKIDYFNDNDVKLIEYASHYLALNIDYFLGEEERNSLISKLSHESQTPANAIRVSADMILKKMGDDRFMRMQFNHYVKSIYEYANLQMWQARSNLYISKFNRNTPKSDLYNLKPTLITEVIKDSINIIRPYARDRGRRFENIVIQKDFPQWLLRIDEDAFKTVFYNLLTNSIKYIKRESQLSVQIDGVTAHNGLVISVSDFGIGIKETEKENIFALGVRGKEATQDNNEGYGIGLHIVQQILSDFGGSIRVSNCSLPTVFEITLPKEMRITTIML